MLLSIWTQVTLASLFLTAASYVIYLLYFHPLRDIPGPFLARLSNAYSAYQQYRGRMHADIMESHEKYGPIIRYGPNRLITMRAEDMNTIYKGDAFFCKSPGYGTMVPWQDGWSTGTTIDKGLHKVLRKNVLLGYNAASIRKFEGAIHRNLEVYQASLTVEKEAASEWSVPQDMRTWNQWLAFDGLAELGLNVRTGLLEKSEDRYVLDLLELHTVKLGIYDQWPSLDRLGLSRLAQIFMSGSPTAQRFGAWHKNFIDEAVEKNKKQAQGIFAPIIRSGTSNGELAGHTWPQMVAEGSFMTFTGADGVSTSLSCLQHYLTKNPAVLEKLQHEIRETFPSGSVISWGPELQSCHYLRACLTEAWRILPPACGPHWRRCAREGVTIGGKPLPVGVDIGVSLFSIFRSEKYFREPTKFWPERWLPGTLPPQELATAKHVHMPFLAGTRSCAGTQVATAFISIALARLVNEYDLRAACKGDMEPDLEYDTHWTIPTWKSGPILQLRPRES